MNLSTISATGANGLSAQTASTRIPQKTLGQEDFLKLLVAQLSAQDPLNPTKDTEFIGQMAQFSALEQARAMQTEMTRMRGDQEFLQANSLLGKPITYQTSKDALPQHGLVSAVVVEAGTPQIVVDGQPYRVGELYSLVVGER